MPTIIDLPGIIGGLKPEDKALFDRFFLLQKSIGRVSIPDEMKAWTEKSFGGVKNVEEQTIIKTFNRISFEGAMFNDLRAKRPVTITSDADSAKAIKDSEGDQFCNPTKGTAADTFGRIKGKRCITASNVAKYDALHGLIIFNKHNPLEFDEKDLRDYLETAMKWFKRANKEDNEAIYPFLLWNCLWRSGSSIIHGHMQLILGEGMHYAEAEFLKKIRLEYYERYKSDYFTDLSRLHQLIGLGLEKKKNSIFMSITPKKDKEVTIIGREMDKHFMEAIYLAASCLIKDFGVQSFNMGIIFPPMIKDSKDPALSGWKDFPVIARIVNRGALNSKTADIGGVEMYARSNVIESDPYPVFEKMKKYF